MTKTTSITKEQVYEWLSSVTDPEVPVLTIQDLGIVRDVAISQTESGEIKVQVIITPTYSGCPAMDAIALGIRMALVSHGVRHIDIEHSLSPAWTTDWMSEEGKRKLYSSVSSVPHRARHYTNANPATSLLSISNATSQFCF